MQRKKFVQTFTGALALPILGMAKTYSDEDTSIKIPPYLKKGDTIGICSPAGYITIEEVTPAIIQLESWGFKVQIGSSIGKKHFTFGGTDDERCNDFQQMLEDKNIKAIMCARGGYGFVRFIDIINFKNFLLRPKWILGFSDITVLHNHLSTLKVASIHSKMCNSFPTDSSKAEPIQIETIYSIYKALIGEKMQYECASSPHNKIGKASGQLIGGNLKTIESLAASKSDIQTQGKILFVEDTGEYLYSIDRMFWNLKRSGKLSKLKGLVIGGFKVRKEESTEDFGKLLEEIVLEKVKEYNYPVCFDFPVGHQKNNFALKCGILYELQVQLNSVQLKEI